MTFLEKIKPHLVSDDYLVQETILHAIHDYPFLPEEWTVQLLEEGFRNHEKLTTVLIYIDNQLITEDAVKILLENIPKMDQSKLHLAIRLLQSVEPSLAIKYRDELKPYIRQDLWELYDLMLHGDEDEIQMKYDEILHLLETADSYQHQLFFKAKLLTKWMVQHEWWSEEEIARDMQEEVKPEWFTFHGILTVYAIGLLKLESYIPTLASLLVRDEDILLEEVATALIGFQSDAVVKEVQPYLLKEESVIFAASVIENIKSVFAIETLKKAYPVVDEEDQELIFEALAHQLSIDALPEIEDYMAKKYHYNIVDTDQVAYAYYSILGFEHPDLQAWKKSALEKEMIFKEESKKNSLLFQSPIKIEPKVGRNDPCPCGSGKKYKKCCGK
ncbi:YecA family protein [Bacillus salitolerans]|uniref:YecA family protein n=1 Tax=Bacillus salitolerans TaxID=1437434 RepID=A0ABW4LWC6_9BACI